MEKNFSRRNFLKGAAMSAMSVAALGLAACGKEPVVSETPAEAPVLTSKAASIFKAGSYSSIQHTEFATVKVSCDFSESALTKVAYEVTETSDSDFFPKFANEIEAYCARIADAGTVMNVDGVSGASLCGSAIERGVKACTAEALGIELEAAEVMAAPVLNPQVDDYTSFDGNCEAVFSPIKLGTMEIKNRVVKSAGSSPWKNAEGDNIPVSVELYGAMAKNDVALNIVTGGTIRNSGILPDGLETKEPLEDALAKYKVIVDTVHENGGLIGYQLCFGGLAPSVPDSVINETPIEDLEAYVERVGVSVERAKSIGFDCAEIKGASADGLNGFLTRRINKREDEYGAQSTENRTRLFCNMIKKIKEVNGADFPVGALINGVEENDVTLGSNEGFTTIEEGKAIAQALEAAGADWIQLRVGANGQEMNIWAPDVQHAAGDAHGVTGYGTQFDYSSHFDGVVDGSRSGFGSFMPMVKAVKEAVSIPVGCAAYMDLRKGPDYLNDAIARGDIDLIFMNRPLNCDPELVAKIKDHRREDVRPCMHCMHCHDGIGTGNKYPSSCRMNASSFNSLTDVMPEGMTPVPADVKKNVMVIGAGPAGMEAARVAAERGHTVSLYDSAASLGGLLHFARAVKGDHESFGDFLTYIEHQLDKNGVDIHLNTTVDIDTIKSASPDAVILAVGGSRKSVLSGANVFSPEAAFGSDKLGEHVVVLGAGVQAIDFAIWLVNKGKKVTVVNPEAVGETDKGQSGWFRTYVMPFLYAKGVKVWNDSEVVACDADGVTIAPKFGIERKIACDSVVEFYNMEANDAMVAEIEAAGIEVKAVGDCSAPHNIQRAVTSGNLAARAI